MNMIERLAREHFSGEDLCKCLGAHKICLNCLFCRASKPDQIAKPSASIASIIDATVLKANTKLEEVSSLCNTALDFECASVCINSFFIPFVNKALKNRVKTCTVINFPLGSGDSKSVLAEASSVIAAGIDELDMVHNIPAFLDGNYQSNFEVIRDVAQICVDNGVLLKVIIETCYLSEEEIVLACLYAKKAGTDFVKTSTGFGSAGATADNIALMRLTVGPKVGVKASGGIRTNDQAMQMIVSGANRIGASSVTALLN